MHFTGSTSIEFDTYARIEGKSGQEISFGYSVIQMTAPGGAKFYANNTVATVYGTDYVEIGFSAGGRIDFMVVSTVKARMNAYGFTPLTTASNMYLGNVGQLWLACYATTFYDGGGGYQDLQDDLLVMAEFKPKKTITIDPVTGNKTVSEETIINPINGLEYMDLLSLPRWMTNYDVIVAKLKEENGDLLSEQDIEELIEDHDEAGWLLSRDVSAFNDCTSGAVRQLDIEIKEMYELIFSRITALENENKLLKERILALETK